MQPSPAATAEEIEDLLAEDLAQRVNALHPTASSRFRRGLVKLWLHQAAGVASAPGRISDRELASYLGESPQRISETRAAGLARAWRTIHEQYPDLL